MKSVNIIFSTSGTGSKHSAEIQPQSASHYHKRPDQQWRRQWVRKHRAACRSLITAITGGRSPTLPVLDAPVWNAHQTQAEHSPSFPRAAQTIPHYPPPYNSGTSVAPAPVCPSHRPAGGPRRDALTRGSGDSLVTGSPRHSAARPHPHPVTGLKTPGRRKPRCTLSAALEC